MTRDELLEALKSVPDNDPEAAHSIADNAIIAYLDDREIKKAYESITRWYA